MACESAHDRSTLHPADSWSVQATISKRLFMFPRFWISTWEARLNKNNAKCFYCLARNLHHIIIIMWLLALTSSSISPFFGRARTSHSNDGYAMSTKQLWPRVHVVMNCVFLYPVTSSDSSGYLNRLLELPLADSECEPVRGLWLAPFQFFTKRKTF